MNTTTWSLPSLPFGDVLVFAPEPVPWLDSICAHLGDRAIVWAPWARSRPPRGIWPGAVRRALSHRMSTDAQGIPGFDLLDVGLARLGADRPTLKYPLNHHRRIAFGRVAARMLERRRAAAVIAPTFAATPLFAAARDRGMTTILVHDWPDLAALHADLDAAGRRHPDDPWLHRFRPSADWIAHQRSERHLADHILVRGRYVASRITDDGVPAERVVMPERPPQLSIVQPGGASVLLVGRGAARAGAHEALALLERMPSLSLIGPLGSAAIPTLRAHPRFRPIEAVDWRTVGAVLAPGWAEAYPAELIDAQARGVPIIATERTAGMVSLDRGRQIEPGDLNGMQAALEASM